MVVDASFDPIGVLPSPWPQTAQDVKPGFHLEVGALVAGQTRVFQLATAASRVSPVTEGFTTQPSFSQPTKRLSGPPPCHGTTSGSAPQNGHGFGSSIVVAVCSISLSLLTPRGGTRLLWGTCAYRIHRRTSATAPPAPATAPPPEASRPCPVQVW